MNADRNRFYAVTVKRTGKEDPTYTQTDDAINEIKRMFRRKNGVPIGQLAFERDSRQRLHAHFTIRHPSFQYTRFQMKGWHVNYQPLDTSDDLKKWFNYLKKAVLSVPLLQQEETYNYYSSHNGFIDV